MKTFFSFIITLVSLTTFAGVPPKITVVGKYKSMDNSIVFISAAGGLVKVPRAAVISKKLTPGEQIIAKVPVKDFLKLN